MQSANSVEFCTILAPSDRVASIALPPILSMTLAKVSLMIALLYLLLFLHTQSAWPVALKVIFCTAVANVTDIFPFALNNVCQSQQSD